MKKLLLSSLFVIAGTVLFAQGPAKKSVAPSPAAVSSATVSAPVIEDMKSDAPVSATDEKKEAKKECSTEEKKACGSKSAKKACCSSKSEVKNEK